MMYMSGNGLQIFSIMMVVMAFKNPLMGLVATNSTFQRFESDGIKDQLILVKLTFVGMQILALALGVWKVNGMGLLPYVDGLLISNITHGLTYRRTTRSDWLAWESAREPLEYAIPAL
jgi:hypothetical protein